MERLNAILVLISFLIILSLSLVAINPFKSSNINTPNNILTSLPSDSNCLQAVMPHSLNKSLPHNFKTSNCVGVTISESTNATTINGSVVFSIWVSNFYPNFTLNDFGVWYINIINNNGQSVNLIYIIQPCASSCYKNSPKILPGTSYGPEVSTWNLKTNSNNIASVESNETYFATFKPMFNDYPPIQIYTNPLPIYIS